MSRQIDLTVALSDEDREWLLARGRAADVALADRLAAGEPLIAVDASAPSDSETSSEPEADDAPAEVAESDSYAEWTKAQLQSELGDRGLNSRGTVAELVARLRENDVEVNADG